jgi:hypothetical protein
LSALPSGVTSNITQPGTGNSGFVQLQAAANAALVNNQAIGVTASGAGVTAASGSFDLTVSPPSSGTITEQIIVVGHSASLNFPTTSGALQPNYSGGSTDGFVSSIRLTTGASTTSQFSFSTFFGGSDFEQVRDVFVDAQGNLYITGRTASTDLPITSGAFQPSYRGGPRDAFVAKFSPSGQLLFSTYLGGNGDDVGYSIFVDALGFIYVSGRTGSTDFPVTAGAYQTANRGGNDCFVVKMKADGTGPLVWGTYVGGTGNDSARGRMTLDAAGNVYVDGETVSADFPTTPNAMQRTLRGLSSGLLFKLSSDGRSLLYSTYVGGTEGAASENGSGGVAVTPGGDVYMCGFTSATTDFPTTPNAFQPTFGGGSADAYVVRVSSVTGALVASTYLGGNGYEECQGLNLDSSGNVLAVGFTQSSNFPTTSGALQTQLRGPGDMFLTKLSADLSSMVFSTYVGGSGNEVVDSTRVELDASENIYFMADTTSIDFPVTSNALQANFGGGSSDVFFIKVSSNGSQILYATYLGGNGEDSGRSMRYKKN